MTASCSWPNIPASASGLLVLRVLPLPLPPPRLPPPRPPRPPRPPPRPAAVPPRPRSVPPPLPTGGAAWDFTSAASTRSHCCAAGELEYAAPAAPGCPAAAPCCCASSWCHRAMLAALMSRSAWSAGGASACSLRRRASTTRADSPTRPSFDAGEPAGGGTAALGSRASSIFPLRSFRPVCLSFPTRPASSRCLLCRRGHSSA